ncbi:hypothetical protein ACHAP3_006828 [Botrytis cinerea]
MASTNGILSPPTQPHLDIALSAKRKRDDNIDQPALINGTSNESKIEIAKEPSTADTQGLVEDLIDVLKSHDPSPSILTRALPESIPSTEPHAKRQKSDGATDSPTILSRATAHEYLTIDEVLKDVDTAASDIIERLQLTVGSNQNQYIPVPAGQSELAVKILAFKKKAHELVRREKAATGLQTNANSNQIINSNNYLSNRNFGSNANAPVTATSEDSKVVLTLYGNAPQPKQLFSSLQLPTKYDGESISQPLREAGLPNGITTTQIVPLQPTSFDDNKKRPQTLGELFPTPPNIHPLKPPKISKSSLPTSIDGWHQPFVADPRSSSYWKQPLTTGQWLDYSNTSSLSPERKRTGVAGSNEDAETAVDSSEIDAAKLDALFRSAYSGFAPTKDDSKAIAPESVLSKIWWQRVGEKRWGDIINRAEGLGDGYPTEPSTNNSLAFNDAEIEELEQAAKEFSDVSIDPSLMSTDSNVEMAAEEKDVEEVLQGISELLETLNSYQRNRHVSLNATGRPISSFGTSETTFMGTPSKPSDSEVTTYEILKSQLALMVAMLPPYAVAKLNSDQLAELSISTKIEVQLSDQKGVMEEDEIAARAKVAAMSAASNTRPTTSSSLHRSSSSAALYGNQYSSPRPAPAPTGQHYATAQTPIRPPPSNLQRPPATAPVPTSYAQRAPSAPSYRPAAYPGPAYSHQFRTPGPTAPQYAQASSQQQQYHHNTPTTSYTRPPTQPYQSIPQSTPQTVRYPSQPPYAAQQQPVQNGAAYTQGYGNGTHVGRQSSPQKPVYNQANQHSQPQVRPPYSTPAPPILPPNATRHMQGQLAQPPVMNGSSQSPQPQPQPQQTLPPQSHNQNSYNNMSTFLTSGEQQTIIDRQRAQIVQQQGTQHQARNTAPAGALGSPQPQINGNSAVAAGL